MLTCCLLLLVSLAVRMVLIQMDLKIGAYVLTLARADALAVGGLLAILLRSERGKAYLSQLTLPVFGGTAFVLALLFFSKSYLDSTDPVMLSIGLTTLALFFGAGLVLAITASPGYGFCKLFSSRTLRYFGRYSYALYVFHHPVAIYLAKYVVSVRGLPTLFGSQIPGLIFFSVVATVISLSLALLSWHLLESRFLALKHSFSYRKQEAVV